MMRWVLLVVLVGFILGTACVSTPVQSSLVGCWKIPTNASFGGGGDLERIYRFDVDGTGYYAAGSPGNPAVTYRLDWVEIPSTDRILVRMYMDTTSEIENLEFTYDAGKDTLCTGGGVPYCNFSRISCAGIPR